VIKRLYQEADTETHEAVRVECDVCNDVKFYDSTELLDMYEVTAEDKDIFKPRKEPIIVSVLMGLGYEFLCSGEVDIISRIRCKRCQERLIAIERTCQMLCPLMLIETDHDAEYNVLDCYKWIDEGETARTCNRYKNRDRCWAVFFSHNDLDFDGSETTVEYNDGKVDTIKYFGPNDYSHCHFDCPNLMYVYDKPEFLSYDERTVGVSDGFKAINIKRGHKNFKLCCSLTPKDETATRFNLSHLPQDEVLTELYSRGIRRTDYCKSLTDGEVK
jgi:hypothetical protein